MKNSAIRFGIHTWIREEEFGRTAFGHGRKHLGAKQIVARLRCKNHHGIAFSPCFEGFRDVVPNDRVSEKAPGLVDDECFQNCRVPSILNCGASTVEHVEEKWFQ